MTIISWLNLFRYVGFLGILIALALYGRQWYLTRKFQLGLLGTLLTLVSLIGLGYFTNKLEEQKTARIEELKQTVTTLRDFSDVAPLDFHGSPDSITEIIKYSSPLTRMLEGTYKITEGRFQFLTGDNIEQQLQQVIREYPNFPFAYYGLAYCLQNRGDPHWKDYAEHAVRIFEQTTKISGHNLNHDRVLAELRQQLTKPPHKE